MRSSPNFPHFLVILFVLFIISPFTTAKYKDVSDRPKCSSSSLPDVLTAPTGARLASLRRLMKGTNLGAYVVPGVDQHMSEYIGPSDKRRQWLTDFTGSSGTAIVTPTKAVLWTDGRYLLQAESELDCNWGVMEMHPDIWTWAIEHLKDVRIGLDPKLFSKVGWEKASIVLASTPGANLSLAGVDSLVDKIWKTPTRPARPSEADIAAQPMKYAGVSWEEKVTHLRSEMQKIGASNLVILDLMEIAWLLNLRGKADIPYNPVFFSFVILPLDDSLPTRLFVGESRVTEEIRKHLKPDCAGQTFEVYVDEKSTEGGEAKKTYCPSKDVVVEEYDAFYDAIDALVKESTSEGKKFWFSSFSNFKIFEMIPKSLRIQSPPTPLRELKAIKNPVEREGMRSAHVKDAVALIKFAAKLEKLVENSDDDEESLWTEIDVANHLKEFRLAEAESRGESFPTIAGFDSNGAIIHYDPTKNLNPATVKKDGMLLLDSGGQYLDGTTDVTRTFHYGRPSEYQKESYTRVMMGQVDLALSIFPEDVVTGNELQVLARSPLWRRGMEYHHGTGHGIGSFLSVHEPPGLKGDLMKAGMFFSDEPGYYVPNQFGIRLENICFTKVVDLPYDEEDQNFLAIESVTLVPYEPKLIIVDLLDNRQRKWLNEYHAECEKVIGRELKRRGETEAYDWLMARTKPIPLLINAGNRSGRLVASGFAFVLALSVVVFRA